MALADFLDFEHQTSDVELGDLALGRDQLKELIVYIECALRLTPGIMDGFSAEEKEALSKQTIRAFQKAGLLSARFH